LKPFRYHSGQREVQREANTVPCADRLSVWVGPVAKFAKVADLVVLASAAEGGLTVGALSGPPPLVAAEAVGDTMRVTLPASLTQVLPANRPCGGIVVNLAQARRARVSGMLAVDGEKVVLEGSTAFTNCRKYMAPTASTGEGPKVGPSARAPLSLSDPWLAATVAGAETAFLATANPEGVGDVSHRGGPPGFLRFDGAAGSLTWTEYLGDGMFVSTGNLRIVPRLGLVVLELATGDAAWLEGEARYENLRASRNERVDALIQDDEPFPVQGRVSCRIDRAARLAGFCHPRVRVDGKTRVTAADATDDQQPR
jgi:uncharacterized protein